MHQPEESLSIIVPVYNEGANFHRLWQEVCAKIHCDFTAYVVYDFDGDDTLPVVNQVISAGETRIRLVKNDKRGVVGAICAGFAQVKSGPVIVVMADLSDDLGCVDPMVALYRQGYDVVAGSRYMKGGRLIGGPFLKQTMSRVAGVTLHWFAGIPTCDATNAFKLYRKTVLDSVTIESQGGFELSLEIVVKAFKSGFKITEVPCTWTDRESGESKFKLWAWLPSYLRWYFYAFLPASKSAKALNTSSQEAQNLLSLAEPGEKRTR